MTTLTEQKFKDEYIQIRTGIFDNTFQPHLLVGNINKRAMYWVPLEALEGIKNTTVTDIDQFKVDLVVDSTDKFFEPDMFKYQANGSNTAEKLMFETIYYTDMFIKNLRQHGIKAEQCTLGQATLGKMLHRVADVKTDWEAVEMLVEGNKTIYVRSVTVLPADDTFNSRFRQPDHPFTGFPAFYYRIQYCVE